MRVVLSQDTSLLSDIRRLVRKEGPFVGIARLLQSDIDSVLTRIAQYWLGGTTDGLENRWESPRLRRS